MIDILIVVIMTSLGALIFRMRGGFGLSFPRPIEQALFASPYALFAYLAGVSPILIALVMVATTIAVLKGHGDDMDLGIMPDREEEWYGFLISWRRKIESAYIRDLIGISFSGLTYTIVAGLVTMNPLLAISGLLKGPAYVLSHKLTKRTELGEWLTGAFLWGSLALIYVFMGV